MSLPITFDIEVAGFPWGEVDEISRGYLLNKARDEDMRAEMPERMALYPGLGKVIVIGLWNLEADQGLVLVEGDHEPEHEWEKVANSRVFRGSETEILERFWEVVAKKRGRLRLVSFNGRGYDGPILMIRSAQLGIRPTMNLVGNRYSTREHIDLMDVLSFHGAWRERYNLDFWCRRFDVESPKTTIDGSQVGKAYREGRIDEIGEYCLRDVRATGELYKKLEPTLLAAVDR